MNKQQRNQWNAWIDTTTRVSPDVNPDWFSPEILLAANAYILKLERELQSIKGGRKVAAILKAKVNTDAISLETMVPN